MTTVTLPGNQTTWLDSGVDVAAGQALLLTATGTVQFSAHGPGGTGDPAIAFPEGYYYPSTATSSAAQEYDPTLVYRGNFVPANEVVCTNLPRYCLAMVVLPSGTTPAATSSAITNALRPNRHSLFTSPQMNGGAGGRVWFLFNDNVGWFADNTGSFSISLTMLPGDPYAMPGSAIHSIDTLAQALQARVHRQATQQYNRAELWFYRDSLWQLFPAVNQPVMQKQDHIVLDQSYRQPMTLACTLIDNDGSLTPENMNSAANTNLAGDYDELLDEARKIRLRAGTFCYTNLAAGITPTANVGVTAGSLANLTDGVFQDFAGTLLNYAKWTVASVTPVEITVDLGSVQYVRHVVARFGTLVGAYILPASLTILTSATGSDYRPAKPARPVGGAGSVGVSPGDWEDDYYGREVEVAVCDLEIAARYVRFRITPVGAQTFVLDELAVYGGDTGQLLGVNKFTGYLGDEIDTTVEGIVKFTARDISKKAADNNEIRTTQTFTNADVSDIVYNLLASSANWPGVIGQYDSAFDATEIGWGLNTAITGLTFPTWQGQNESNLGYCQELYHETGWAFYGDGNGVWQAFDPPYRQRLPDRVCIHDPDGNQDTRHNKRKRSGNEMRNVVRQTTSSTNRQAAATVNFEPNSVRKYGRRSMSLSDPIMNTDQLRSALTGYVLRDYAWRLKTLSNDISPLFEMRLKQIFGFRASQRISLYSKASSVTGNKRLRELWSVERIVEHITPGDWWAECDYIPYVPASAAAPLWLSSGNSLVSSTGTAFITVNWQAVTDVHVTGINIYVSATSDSAGYVKVATVPVSSTSQLLATYDLVHSLIIGNQYWVYLSCTDDQGFEGLPGSPLSVVCGTGNADNSAWAITDLSAALAPQATVDGSGYYHYAYQLTFTSPPNGTKAFEEFYAIGTLPADPSQSNQWQYDDEWHSTDRTDPKAPGASVTSYSRVSLKPSSPGPFASGTHLYFRMWTRSKVVDAGNGDYFASNIAVIIL